MLAYLPNLRRSRERYAFVVGNEFCQLPGRHRDPAVVIAFPEVGYEQATRVTCTRISDHRFEAVADFRPILAVIGGDQQQDSAIIFFRSNPKLLVQTVRVSLDFGPVQGFDGHDGHLRAGLFLQFLAERFELNFCLRLNNSSAIGDVAGWVEILEIIRARGAGHVEYEAHDTSQRDCNSPMHPKDYATARMPFQECPEKF